jgi:uncharacterized hydrophobic protein (TIGR00271 family)
VATDTEDRAGIGDYVNHTTLRGGAFIVAGMIALLSPATSQFLLTVAVSGVLIVNGTIDLYAAVRAKPRRWTAMFVGFVYVVTGLGLLVTTEKTVRVLTLIIGAVAVLRGVTLTIAAIRNRKTRPTWVFDFVRGLMFVTVGMVVVVIPESIITGLIFAIAGAVIVYGAVTLSFGIMHADEADVDTIEVGGYIKAWLDQRDVGDDMRADVIDNLFFEEPDSTQKQVGFWVLLVLSTAIATLGIIADSTAVVIGAMLVAPLMTPILGVSAAIVNGWPKRVTMSFSTVAGGVAVSIATAWIVAAWTPQLVPLATNSQVLSRISPTLVDMMIAVAAGAAGAYATVDRRVSSSITGVAIAVALVPPLGVVGLTLKAGNLSDASGAFLLFLTNLVSIILIAAIVFVIAGLVPISQFREHRQKMRTVISTVVVGALAIMLPLVFTSEGILASAARQSTAQRTTEAWLEDSPDLSLNKVTVRTNAVDVVITGEGDVPDVGLLEAALEDALTDVDVVLTVEYFPSVRLVPGGS